MERTTLAHPSPPERRNPPQAPESFLAYGILRRYSAGSTLFSQGDEADRMYLIVSGEVAVVASGRDGDEIEVARIGQGNWLGEAVMIARAPYPSTARACADVEALAFPREALDGPMSSDPGTARFLLGLLAAKCVGLNKRIEELTVMPARERLARHIVGLYPGGIAERAPGVPCQVRLPRKKREMAALLGIAPETLSRVMRSLEGDGIIEVKASRILIRDCPRLLAEAGL